MLNNSLDENFKATILIVDDEKLSAEIVIRTLSTDIITLYASNAEQALIISLKTPPDIILMDINMGGMSGLEACEVLKNNDTTKDIPIIFMTSDAAPETEDKCWNAGAVDFINKPFSMRTLQNRVKSHLSVKRMTDKLKELATIDSTTNIQNRRFLDYYIDEQSRLAVRKKTSLGFLLIDIDLFKSFNDTYGHLKGDDVLRIVAKTLEKSLKRPADCVARYGGEEFGVVLPDTDAKGLQHMADIILHSISALAIPHSASPFDVLTVSIGGSLFKDSSIDIQDLIERADKNLYRAKEDGRNQLKMLYL